MMTRSAPFLSLQRDFALYGDNLKVNLLRPSSCGLSYTVVLRTQSLVGAAEHFDSPRVFVLHEAMIVNPVDPSQTIRVSGIPM